ncbi:MAG: hypothetical protein JXR64_04240 [Spirochaetales bacterium]|nr:hypothetical protein [Spirochaetales bacterium]
MKNRLPLYIMTLFALIITLLLSEVIYPEFLKDRIVLPSGEITKYIDTNLDETETEEINFIPSSDLERAIYYFENKAYSSSWIYSDKVLSLDKNNSVASEIRDKSEQMLQGVSKGKVKEKYLENQIYKNFINQNNYLEAYYFCLDNINKSSVYNHDFLIKLQSCYQDLLKSNYSINIVEDNLKRPGYSNIEFYSTKNGLEHYKIEKLVFYKNSYYLKNVSINNKNYPYLYIDSERKLFSSGFNENFKFYFKFDVPEIPVNVDDLKLFSKEFYNLSYNSLYFNLKVLSLKNIKYFNENILLDLIFNRLTSYASILIIFFMGSFSLHRRDYLNYLFNYGFLVLSAKWIIKKTGLLLSFYWINLSIFFVILIYVLWLVYRIIKFNPLPSQS